METKETMDETITAYLAQPTCECCGLLKSTPGAGCGVGVAVCAICRMAVLPDAPMFPMPTFDDNAAARWAIINFHDALQMLYIHLDDQVRRTRWLLQTQTPVAVHRYINGRDWHAPTQRDFSETACELAWNEHLLGIVAPAYTTTELIKGLQYENEPQNIDEALRFLHAPATRELWAAWNASSEQWRERATRLHLNKRSA